MTRHPRLMPEHPRMFSATVVRSVRLAPSFQRVTVAGADLADFEWRGFDHWFRLFLPPAPGAPLVLPRVSGRSWWKPYLAIAEHERPHCSNYTVAALRRTAEGGAEMDIDVVLHHDSEGAIAGGVAIWASTATAGSPLAMLDQGPLFDPPADTRAVHLVTDESGLPAVRGILRDLSADAAGTAIIEVPSPGDVEELTRPADVDVTWIVRHDQTAVPGAAALAAVQTSVAAVGRVDPLDYAFVVGESTLATEGRRAVHRAGLPKSRILFSGFWKHEGH
ncbi:MAG: siderophore-interacting protein [Herbiconiux sp.]|uniref:siderophore-interacting protein n=1 Tax=Herbiconiux sp. TaxID=1871186 RepID=UPI00121A3D18|nr:siderophore-interacting protein [Herbiconiux sp.]TAJ49503.1 MAG: siderophore-interacting protein [Herbiconiux sp.]